MPWAAAAAVVGTVYSSNKSSKAQKEASTLQAEGVENASRISQEAAREAKADALALFNPAFADVSTSLNQARGDILAGRSSAQNILNQAFMKSGSTYQTAGQQAMNAILGRGTGAPQQTTQEPYIPPTNGIPEPQLQNQVGFPDIGIPAGGGGFQQAPTVNPINQGVAVGEPNQGNPINPNIPDYLMPTDGGLRSGYKPQPYQSQNLRGDADPMQGIGFENNGNNFKFRHNDYR